MIADSNLDTGYCDILTAPGCSEACSVRVQPVESSVTFDFWRVLGGGIIQSAVAMSDATLPREARASRLAG